MMSHKGKHSQIIYKFFEFLISGFVLERFRQALLYIPACKLTNVCIVKIEAIFAAII